MNRAGTLHARRVRVARGAASAAVSTLVAATAHTLSGGIAPLWLMVAAALLATPVSVLLVGRRPSTARTALVVLASQGLFHTFFGFAGAADPSLASGHLHVGAAETAPLPHLHAPSLGMVAAHVLAAAVTLALLAHGERMLSALGRGILRLIRRLTPVVPVLRRPVSAGVATSRRPGFSLVRGTLSLRGPPAVAA